jgi:hypothetical protein
MAKRTTTEQAELIFRLYELRRNRNSVILAFV